jgi:hypothetical protein
MSAYDPQRRRQSKVRERYAARQRRRSPMGVRDESAGRVTSDGDWLQVGLQRAQMLLQDARWHLRHNPAILGGAVFVVVILVLLYLLSFVVTGRIFPNVHVFGVGLGSMSVTEAEDTLRAAWRNDIEIALLIGTETVATVPPDRLGLRLNAGETARDAQAVGFGALPFGREVEPVVEVEYLTAQNYLLDLADEVDINPYDAGYEWRDGEVIGVEGRNGRMLDVALTIEQLMREAAYIVNGGRMELLMISLPPDVRDPSPYLEDARALAQQRLELTGYDPYTNRFYTWPVGPEVFVSWLTAGRNSLELREDVFIPFIDVLTDTLNQDEGVSRYLALDETTGAVRQAITNRSTSVDLRVRYRETVYEVQRGDTVFGISRKTGVPFYLIEEFNPGRNLDVISPGDTIRIPTRDVTMPEPPVHNKRIIVDLNRQYLTAYENGEVIFEWPIASGVTNAPTSPGIYQILTHAEVAYGSSVLLCNNANLVCGQWAMNWFMGIYEVRPGLLNGFHGEVLLPNGGLLGGGAVGAPATFGCVMSDDVNARRLYEWAEVGTVVEIISHEYAPLSDLGQHAVNRSA